MSSWKVVMRKWIFYSYFVFGKQNVRFKRPNPLRVCVCEHANLSNFKWTVNYNFCRKPNIVIWYELMNMMAELLLESIHFDYFLFAPEYNIYYWNLILVTRGAIKCNILCIVVSSIINMCQINLSDCAWFLVYCVWICVSVCLSLLLLLSNIYVCMLFPPEWVYVKAWGAEGSYMGLAK